YPLSDFDTCLRSLADAERRAGDCSLTELKRRTSHREVDRNVAPRDETRCLHQPHVETASLAAARADWPGASRTEDPAGRALRPISSADRRAPHPLDLHGPRDPEPSGHDHLYGLQRAGRSRDRHLTDDQASARRDIRLLIPGTRPERSEPVLEPGHP